MKYTINKKGRKWLHAQDGIGQKAQILINEISKNYIVGNTYDVIGAVEYKKSYGYIKVNITPMTIEKKEELINNKEVEKWLGYVENQTEYIYTKGVNRLKELKLNEEQKQRLENAIKTAQINYSKNKISDYLRYTDDRIAEYGSWYEKGENTVVENIKILDGYKVDTINYKNELEELKELYKITKDKKEEEKEEIKKANEKRYFEISDISISKSDNYEIGSILVSHDNKLGKVVSNRKYFETDSMSFGYMEADGCWLKIAKCDTKAVTENDIKEYEEKIRIQEEKARIEKIETEKKQEKQKNINKLINDIKNTGICPDKNEKISLYEIEKNGRIILDTFNIYGGGEKIIIDDTNIWYINNNGADGDYWDINNILTGGAGGVGYYKKINEEILKIILAFDGI